MAAESPQGRIVKINIVSRQTPPNVGGVCCFWTVRLWHCILNIYFRNQHPTPPLVLPLFDLRFKTRIPITGRFDAKDENFCIRLWNKSLIIVIEISVLRFFYRKIANNLELKSS